MRSSNQRPQPRTQNVRAAATPPTDPSAIPPPLVAYFQGRGIRVSLASYAPREVSRCALHQRILLRIEEIPETDRPKVERLLLEGGFRRVDGHFLRGDTALFVQPFEKYEQMGWDAYRSWTEQQPNPEREAEALYDAVDGSVRHGVRVQPVTAPPNNAEIRPVD